MSTAHQQNGEKLQQNETVYLDENKMKLCGFCTAANKMRLTKKNQQVTASAEHVFFHVK